MLTKTGLSTDQQEDVRKAQRYYSLEDGVWKQDWDYAYDAYTLDNLKTATTLLDEINKVRASDENFNAQVTKTSKTMPATRTTRTRSQLTFTGLWGVLPPQTTPG